MSKTENTFYVDLDWQSKIEDGEPILIAKLDVDRHRIYKLAIAKITDGEQRLIDQYDAHRYQKMEDKYVFYVQWIDGEWQPRHTFPDLDTAQKSIDAWWLGYTIELSERASNDM